MSISFHQKNKIFRIDTKNTTYAFCITNLQMVEHLYYGRKIDVCGLPYVSNRQIYTFSANLEGEGREFSESSLLWELSSGNSTDFRDGAVWIENADGTTGNRFAYHSHEIYEGRTPVEGLPHSHAGADTQTLVLRLYDEEKQVEADIYYVVFPEEDVIARHVEFINRSNAPLKILKASSLQVDFARADFDLVECTGMYAYELAKVQRTPLKKGLQGIKSGLGSTSHNCNPLIILCERNANEDMGEAYGFNLIYSGAFENQIEVDRLENTRVLSGINKDGLCYTVAAGDKFVTPEGIMTYSREGIGQVSRNFHDHVRNHIIPEKFVNTPRPLVVNTWEGSGMDVTEDSVLSLARSALEVGADTVVLDDGWFRGSIQEGLADFFLDKQKFPNGLKPVADEIRAMGLKFGIWFEPECVVPISTYIKEHPDCALRTRKATNYSREQFVLDFTDEQNVENIYQCMIAVLDDVQADYLKWDYNRYIHEAGSKITPYGELNHRQVLGVYKLMQKIRDRYPDMLIEGCAGGGGRFDLGILYYSPQIWVSDNTDPNGRVYIQNGATYGYPTSAISCHVTHNRGAGGVDSSLYFRYLVACLGPYGYELDITKLSKEERAELHEYTKNYRKIAQYTLDCDFYRIIDVAGDLYSAYMQVSKDKSKALFTFVQLNAKAFYETIMVRLKGLDEKAIYRVESTGRTYSGSTLMYAGLRLNDLFKVGNGGGFHLEFTKINKKGDEDNEEE